MYPKAGIALDQIVTQDQALRLINHLHTSCVGAEAVAADRMHATAGRDTQTITPILA